VTVAAVVTAVLSDRVLATIVAVLACGAIAITLYLAVTVMVQVLTGTPPAPGFTGYPMPGPTVATLVTAALGLVGLEICTTRNRRLRSAGWSMGLPAGIVGVTALFVWLAVRSGPYGANPPPFGLVVPDYLGASGGRWITIAQSACLAAMLLVLLWGATNIAADLYRRILGTDPPWVAVTAAVAVLAAAVGIALSRDWVGHSVNIGYLAAVLILVLYLLAAEANARTAGDRQGLARWMRVLVIVIITAAVLIPVVLAAPTPSG